MSDRGRRAGCRLRDRMRFPYARAFQIGIALCAFAVGCTLGACAGDSPGPDTTPPATVTDLALARATETTATLTWTAPGDDGDGGRTVSYDLRYSLSAFPVGWDSAAVVQGLAVPRQAGEPETVTVSGLTRDYIYYLALRTLDYVGNESDLSNVVQAQTADPTPPGRVTDLRASGVEMTAVTIQFTAPGDDGYEGTATAYEVRYRPDPVTELTWDESTAFAVTQPPYPAGTVETLRMEGLAPGVTLHFALRARDDGGQVGLVSNDVEVTLLPDMVPPATVVDLAVIGADLHTVSLTWTAPGDDSTEGQAAAYDLRYALDAPPEAWDVATVVQGLAIPRQAGEAETVTVAGLERDKVYYLAFRTVDDAGNASGLSNVVHATTSDLEAPGRVTDLRATVVEVKAVTLRFTAPGDDGYEGTAVAYELRYGPNPVTEESWEESTPFPLTHSPRPPGTNETVWVTGLTPEATLHFALRARDDGGLVGPVSNDVEVTLPADTAPPAAIWDLAVAGSGPYTVSLTWTAPGDDGTDGQASSYEVRYATAAITEGTWSEATPVSVALAPKRAWEREELTLRSLPGEQILWFCVRASDGKGNQGGVSNAAKGYVYPVARTWLIRPDGTGDAPTVQAGIDSSAGLGDTVLVAPGRYYEDIDFLGKGVVLKSLLGPAATILDGSREDSSVVMFFRDEPSSAVLEGFTITGGRGTPSPGLTSPKDGGGIWCPHGSPLIRKNLVTGNRAKWGGGVYIGSPSGALASPVFEENQVQENTAGSGGGGLLVNDSRTSVVGNSIRANKTEMGDGGGVGVIIARGSVRLFGNRVEGNDALDHGGGIHVYMNRPLGAEDVFIEENLIADNIARGGEGGDTGSGGGIGVAEVSGTIRNNTIVGNIGLAEGPCNGGGIVMRGTTGALYVAYNIIAFNTGCGVICREIVRTTMGPNIMWENTVGDVSDVCPDTWQSLMLTVDPLFCDRASGDYAVSEDSPAVTGEHVMGAFATPGCAPTVEGTWARMKQRY